MKSSTKNSKMYLRFVDAAAQVFALWYLSSVINSIRSFIEKDIKNAPSIFVLIFALTFIIHSSMQTKKVDIKNAISLTVLFTATSIWLFV